MTWATSLLIAVAFISSLGANRSMPEVIEFCPQPGPQTAFLSTPADIAIYGGAAGSGKSYALLLDPLRHIHIPGFKCSIFRRECVNITKQGAIWDESTSIYPHFATPKVGALRWDFPTPGVSIGFEHCEHEQDVKAKYQGTAFAALGFDELTHFTAFQFWYLFSRNRSKCGVRPYIRATCNPEPDSWLHELLSWWLDEDGDPIPSRSGVLRWLVRKGEDIHWADSQEELIAQHREWLDEQVSTYSTPEHKLKPEDFVKSFTFISAKISDNQILLKADPGYLGSLLALPDAERRKLLHGNWKRKTGGLIDERHFRWYEQRGEIYLLAGVQYELARCKRFATIDTAGSGKDRAKEEKGRNPSYTVCGIWDSCRIGDSNLLFLRQVYRKRVEYGELKRDIPEFLSSHNCKVVRIENATLGQALRSDLTEAGYRVDMLPTKLPGQKDAAEETSKYERAVASGLFAMIENGWVCLPVERPAWVRDYLSELTSFKGLPKDVADQLDMSSYAAYHVRHSTSKWDGPVSIPTGGRMNSVNTGARR